MSFFYQKSAEQWKAQKSFQKVKSNIHRLFEKLQSLKLLPNREKIFYGVDFFSGTK